MLERLKQLRDIRLAVAVVVTWFASVVMSCSEIQYATGSEVTRAIIVKVTEDRRTDETVVKYQFKGPDGSRVIGHARYEKEWVRPEDNRLAIRYQTSDPKTSRPDGPAQMRWPIAFFMTSGLAVLWVVNAVVTTMADLRR